MRPTGRRAFAIVELLATCAIVVVITAVTLPALARIRGDDGVMGSQSNLVTLAVAHVVYAADWNGRQVTWVLDDLGVYDSMEEFNEANGCFGPLDPGCHPPVIAGWGCDGWEYGYRFHQPFHLWAHYPINFTGGAAYFGNFRLANFRALHMYVTGRVYDPIYYAPNDVLSVEAAAPGFDEPCEYPPELNPPIWSSYALSPAAMYHPNVMRANADGGFQDPWSIDEGFESPGLFQAQYPSLKTHMIEHHWLQNAPGPCNPEFGQFGGVLPCEPYYFNHGIDSSPLALFYDGSVRLLPNAEVLAGDQQILDQTGGVDGLWHRGTPFGDDGYFISVGFDGVALSHHVLTTDGILGRDTLGVQPGSARPRPARWKGVADPPEPAFVPRTPFSLLLTTDREDG